MNGGVSTFLEFRVAQYALGSFSVMLVSSEEYGCPNFAVYSVRIDFRQFTGYAGLSRAVRQSES